MMRMSMSVVVPVFVRRIVRVLVAMPFVRMGMRVHCLYSTSVTASAQPLHFPLLLDG